MKVWILLALALFVFSGCSTKTQNKKLRAMNVKQAAIIKQQQAHINALQSKIRTQKAMKKNARMKKKKRKVNKNKHKNTTLPKAPKKNIVLKKVEDKNYSSSYMYPGAQKTSTKPKTTKETPVETTSQAAPSSSMTKMECISMIGQAKFDKYTQMFGNEAASLKRCKILKAMK